jgi:gluconokinase
MTVLVLDIGTSSARALLFDDHARPIPGALIQHRYDVTTTPPGAATLDAEELRGIVEKCVDEILQHPAAKDIHVVGMATFVGNLLGVDKDGKPVTPIYLYADTRSAEDVEQLRLSKAKEIENIHQRTGCPIHTAYHPARLQWLARTQSDTFATTKWTDFATYLYISWFGTPTPCSYSVASWSGLFLRVGLDWYDYWLYEFAHVIASQEIAEAKSKLPSGVGRLADVTRPRDYFKFFLPSISDYNDTKTNLANTYAERWSTLKDVPFCLAIGDGAAANIGTGCCDTTRVALSLGTTAAMRVTIQRNSPPPVPLGLWCYRITRDLHLMGGATSEGGNLHRWSRETLQLPPDFTDQLALLPVDGHGLTALPLLAGERSPGWSLDATGSIAGLRLSTTPLDIAQAMFEGLALRLAIIYEQLGDYVDKESEIIASGGALSPYMAQIIADALNHPLKVTAETEITSRGVALLALKAIGVDVSLNEPPEIAYEVQPRREAVAALRAARVRQADLYRKMVSEQVSPT